ncbi:hypothetical protein [Aquipseudomonas ullengensis]|nr:hypothetical protein [Pseudomonas ullengensis]
MTIASVRVFAPEQWGQVDIFRHFHIGTHSFNSDTKKAISGITNHFQKALTLYELALKLLPNLNLDEEELLNKGYTGAANSREFSAVLEEVFTELYSSIDCTRKIIANIYRKTRRLPNSTRQLFDRVNNNILGDDFPTELKLAISSSDWYGELLAIRDELTHSDIGNCHLDQKTRLVTYMHVGIRRNGEPLIIDDVLGRIKILINSVNEFLGSVFHFLNSKLQPVEIDQLCGFFKGRGYLRKLALEFPMDFNSGICMSHVWFDGDLQFKCPFVGTCGAYERAKFNAPTPFSGSGS